VPARAARDRPGRHSAGRLRRYGAGPRKLRRYPGLKEEYFLHDFEPIRASWKRSGRIHGAS
jgi:hypothetical protein